MEEVKKKVAVSLSEVKELLKNQDPENMDQIQRWTEPFQSPGTYSIKWMPENKSSGIYFYQLKVGNKVETNKCIFLK